MTQQRQSPLCCVMYIRPQMLHSNTPQTRRHCQPVGTFCACVGVYIVYIHIPHSRRKAGRRIRRNKNCRRNLIWLTASGLLAMEQERERQSQKLKTNLAKLVKKKNCGMYRGRFKELCLFVSSVFIPHRSSCQPIIRWLGFAI